MGLLSGDRLQANGNCWLLLIFFFLFKFRDEPNWGLGWVGGVIEDEAIYYVASTVSLCTAKPMLSQKSQYEDIHFQVCQHTPQFKEKLFFPLSINLIRCTHS